MNGKPLDVVDKWQKPKVIIAIIGLLFLAYPLYFGSPIKKGGLLGAGGNPISAPVSDKLGVNSSSTVGSTALNFLANKSDAQYRRCTNTGSKPITYSATTTKLVADKSGTILTSSSSFEMSGDGLWTGDFWGITPVDGTSTISCMQI